MRNARIYGTGANCAASAAIFFDLKPVPAFRFRCYPDRNRNFGEFRNVPKIAGDRLRALSVSEIRRRICKGKTYVFQELQSGRLRSFRLGNRRLVMLDDFEQWLRENGAPLGPFDMT